MQDRTLILLKQKKLLSDCVEFKRTGWLPSYHLHLTEEFKSISQLDGYNLKQALITYRQHPETIRNPNPAWTFERSCDLAFIVLALSVDQTTKNLTLVNEELFGFQSILPILLLTIPTNVMMFLGIQQSTQKCLNFAVYWSRGEAALTSWNGKYSVTNIKFAIFDLLSGFQQAAKLGPPTDNPINNLLSNLYINYLLEIPKKIISSRIPEQELKTITEIMNFEEKVNKLVNPTYSSQNPPQNRQPRQSWCEWLMFGIFGIQKPQQHDAIQEVPAPPENIARPIT